MECTGGQCYIAEALGVTRDALETTYTAFHGDTAAARSTLYSVHSLSLSDTGQLSDEVEAAAFPLMVDTVRASDWAAISQQVVQAVSDSARVRGTTHPVIDQLATSTASGSDRIEIHQPVPLVTATGRGVDLVLSTTYVHTTISDRASGRDSATSQSEESVLAAGEARDIVLPQRVVEVVSVSGASVTDSVDANALPDLNLLVDTAQATDQVQVVVEYGLLVSTSAWAWDQVTFVRPDAQALVMNTESIAVSLYDNFPAESIAQWGNDTYAVMPDGIYLLKGDTDGAEAVHAEVQTGFFDMGSSKVKRFENLYLGYTAADDLQLTLEVYDNNTPEYTYSIEQRNDYAPRNSRIVPGKGLWGRYWRATFTNRNGGEFHIRDAEVDVAESTRRI